MARPIMIQGTMSNVGKSLIAAGLCRIFKQDGYRVAPFKSQNMALNSYITREGLEMGRAQVMQAHAAGVEPIAAMNPVLLKPTGDVGSQVIVNGKVLGNMSAREYFSYKTQLIPDILNAYHTLDLANDVIVIEGAGSPAEINLKEQDIVNMGLAGMVDSPVLLVGDIDRGGVFAQLIGTLMLLEPGEQERVKGLIVNKFRGDKAILEPGVKMLEDRTGKPVVGVTPYMQLDLEDEDSLSPRFDRTMRTGGELADVAVIRLPRISNFTDMQSLEEHPQLYVYYVGKVSELGNPDMIILPGTKNTIADLRWLRECGLESAIKKCHSRGAIVFGICGGYQMLGSSLSDPHHIEEGGSIRGMELLSIDTVLDTEKTLTRASGVLQKLEGPLEPLSGLAIEGYEIHAGQTSLQGGCPLGILTDERTREEKDDGCQFDGTYGTYLHGFFDMEGIVATLVRALAAKKGMEVLPSPAKSHAEYLEEQYELLASGLREHLDLDAIYQMMGLS